MLVNRILTLHNRYRSVEENQIENLIIVVQNVVTLRKIILRYVVGKKGSYFLSVMTTYDSIV